MSSVRPVEIYRFVEEWWGYDLGPELLAKIAKSPIEQLVAFEEDWPSFQGLEPQVAIPDLAPGSIRPVLRLQESLGRTGNATLEKALALLLLVPSAVVDSLYLDPFEWLDRGWRSHFTSRYDFDGSDGLPDWRDEMRRLLPVRLNLMASIRPLIEDGSLVVANMRLNLRDRSFFDELYSAIDAIDEELVRVMPPGTWDPDPPDHIDIDDHTRVARQIAIPIELARAGKATLVSESKFDDDLWRHMLARPLIDGRVSRLDKLSQLLTPRFTSDVAGLVRLRQSVESYATLRAALVRALDEVEQIPSTEDGRREAADVVRESLRDELASVEGAVGKSPALSAIRDGSTRFTISTIGLAAGAVAGATGGLLSGVAGGLAGATAAGIQRYLQSVADRRNNRVVWDFVLSLRNDQD